MLLIEHQEIAMAARLEFCIARASVAESNAAIAKHTSARALRG
jgi:hypothetical protein